MQNDELEARLRRAANATPPIDDVPLDAIHARERAMRRQRAFAVSAAALVIAALVGGGIAGLRRSGPSETHTAAAPAATTTTAPGRGGITIPAANGADMAPPTAAHYYKATVTLTIREHALLADLPKDGLDSVVALVDDAAFLDVVARQTGSEPAWIRPRIDARARGEVDSVDITAIGTDAAATERLAEAASDECAKLVDERSAVSYQAAIESLQTEIDKLRQRTTTQSIDRRIGVLEAQLSSVRAREVALRATTGTFMFTPVNRAKAIEINEAGFAARWQAAVARTDH